MTWVPPFFTCGECGGQIGRWPMRNLLKQDILDWRHRTVPDSATPHRAVLGTPVPPTVRLHLEEPAAEEETPDPVPPAEILARPAMHDELPSSARSFDKLAAANGWEVEAWFMRGPWMDARWKFSRIIDTVVLRMRRDGVGVVAIWDRDDDWAFAGGFVLTHTTEPAGSPELRKVIKHPRMICETCGESFALHVWTDDVATCYRDTTAEK